MPRSPSFLRVTPDSLLVRALFGSLAWFVSGCGHHDAPTLRSVPADSSVAAIGRDRPEHLVLPLAPAGSGRVVFEQVAPARAELSLPPPPAEPSAPPPTSRPEPVPEETFQLKPPIPRGAPQIVRAGRGGRVTLDVRVDEHGEVNDVILVETDADSLTVAGASDAALVCRYYPALLGQRRVAVWCRQVFHVERGVPAARR